MVPARIVFEVFDAVVDLASEEREAALASRCGDDTDLRRDERQQHLAQ